MYGMGLGREERSFSQRKVNERRENIKKILKNIKWRRMEAKKIEENLFINNILHLKWSFLNRKMDMNELETFFSCKCEKLWTESEHSAKWTVKRIRFHTSH